MRQRILDEIRRIAVENDGKVPGQETFARKTGIRVTEWLGRYWARWSDAVKEAGLMPNALQQRTGTDVLLRKLAEATRHYGHVPTHAELKLRRQDDPELPWGSTFQDNFGTRAAMIEQFREWLASKPEFVDVRDLLPVATTAKLAHTRNIPDGWVYLIKYGPHHKIGRGDELEKRVKQVQTALPDKGELVHAIRTDDPSGIEAYWHRRFADKRANGEWFKLASSDIAAFKRRKFQ